MRTRKAQLMEELLPRLQIILPEKDFIDPFSLFAQKPSGLWLEVGFGSGEHLAAQAMAHPNLGFIGCEPFVNGIAGLLDHLDRENLKNIRIYPDDARHLIDALPDASLERCFVLFSDPWPKARHAERRFIGPLTIPRLARVLKQGAELRLATDHPSLADHMREHLNKSDFFTCLQDAAQPPADWVRTRYEEKGLKAGRLPVYLSYRRL